MLQLLSLPWADRPVPNYTVSHSLPLCCAIRYLRSDWFPSPRKAADFQHRRLQSSPIRSAPSRRNSHYVVESS